MSEASIYNYKARMYLPSLGRFAQSDPVLLAGGMNIYAYVGNDPINAVDPTGTTCQYRIRETWNIYSNGTRELVSSETYTVGNCAGGSLTLTRTGNGESSNEEEEEERERYCSRLAAAVVSSQGSLGSYSQGWRWNSMEALQYDRWTAGNNVRDYTGASFIFGGVSSGAFLVSREYPHPALNLIGGVTGILSLGSAGMAFSLQSELNALDARIEQLQAQAAGIC